MPKKKLTAIDLFSGSGGLTLGLKHAGFRVIGAVECDSLAVETYRINHKNTILWETDIRDLSVLEVKWCGVGDLNPLCHPGGENLPVYSSNYHIEGRLTCPPHGWPLQSGWFQWVHSLRYLLHHKCYLVEHLRPW